MYATAHNGRAYAISQQKGSGNGAITQTHRTVDHLGQEPWAWTRADRRLSDDMARYWTNFARGGDPNGAGLPAWPRFTDSAPDVLYLDDPIHSGPVADLATLSVFDAVYGQVRAMTPHPAPAR